MNVVFSYIRKQEPVNLLSLRDLSHRFAFLLCLLSGQRCQTIYNFSLDNMSIEDSKVTFVITEKLKHTQAGRHQPPLEFLAYPIDQKLCIVTHLKVYLDKTKSLRNDEKQLFISCIRPHKAVSCETISQWIKNFMTVAGIDTSVYKSHTTRAASASFLKEGTFHRFYHRDIVSNFSSALLNASV